MAFTDAENQRILTIEETLNDCQTAINNLMTKTQMRQLIMIKQGEIDALTKRVEDLESQLTILQSKLG